MLFPYMLFVSLIFSSAGAAAQEYKLTPYEDIAVKTEKDGETVYDKEGKLFSGAVVIPDAEGRKITYFYRNGKRDGRAFSRYEDGNPEMAVDYHKGVKDGEALYFYGNEKLRLKQTYKNNVLNGEEVVYYENGQPQYLRHYKDGKLEGEAAEFAEDGSPVRKEHYKNGIKNGIEHIIANNILREEHNYVDGKYDGLSKIYNDKYLEEEINYKNGVRDGISIKYNEDGSFTKIPYAAGEKNGLAAAYYTDKKIAAETYFLNGEKNGISKVYDKTGKLRKVEIYKNGKKEGISRVYDEDGYLSKVRYYLEDTEMASFDVPQTEEISEMYRAYRLGSLGKYLSKKSKWYPLLWLGLNLESQEILNDLAKSLEMYNAALNDTSVYERESKTKFASYNRDLFFGLTPLSYVVNLSAPADILQKFAVNQAAIEEKNQRGGTPLQEAIRLNNLDMVRYLLLKGADIETDFKEKGSVLFYAFSENTRPEIMEELLKKGADINAKDAEGYTILMKALQSNNPQLVNLLLSYNPDLTGITPDGTNLLAFAYGCGAKEEILDKLFSAGVELNKADKNGNLLLLSALRKKDKAFVEKLINTGADVNLTDGLGYNAAALVLTPELEDEINSVYVQKVNLGKIIPAEQKALWRLLLEKQRIDLLTEQLNKQNSLRAVDENGEEPLTEMLKMKTDKKARELALANLSAEIINQNPEYVWLVLETRDLDAWRALTAKNFNPEIYDGEGNTVLLHLLKKNYPEEFIKIFESLHPDVNKPDDKGITPFELALQQKNMSAAKDFISMGADVNGHKDGLPYLVFWKELDAEQTKFLLDEGVNTDFVGADGKTMLMYAVENLNKTLVEFLLANKAEIKTRDKNGDTSYFHLVDAAVQNKILPEDELREKIKNMAELLILYGAEPNARGSNGETILVRLAQRDKELYKKLLPVFKKLGVDETIADQYRKTAADYAE